MVKSQSPFSFALLLLPTVPWGYASSTILFFLGNSFLWIKNPSQRRCWVLKPAIQLCKFHIEAFLLSALSWRIFPDNSLIAIFEYSRNSFASNKLPKWFIWSSKRSSRMDVNYSLHCGIQGKRTLCSPPISAIFHITLDHLHVGVVMSLFILESFLQNSLHLIK